MRVLRLAIGAGRCRVGMRCPGVGTSSERGMIRLPSRRVRYVACAVLLACVGSGRFALAAQFDVTTAADAGPGSLRQALLDAAAASGADDIVIAPGLGAITVSSELAWTGVAGTNPVTISGNGVHLDFGGAPRGFVDRAGKGLTISYMTITGVGPSTTGNAAPVLSEGGDMVLDHCTISGNTVVTTKGTAHWFDVAGAVLSEGGSVTILACTISGNVASGPGDGAGGVLSEGGPLVVSDSTIESNSVHAGGDAAGGLASEGGNVLVTGTTIGDNHATGGGDTAGGLLSEGGDVTVDASTFTSNCGATSGNFVSGNGIVSAGPAPVVTNTTVTDDPSACIGAIGSYFLPTRVKAKFDPAHPEKSTLVAAGLLDTGSGPCDLTQAATLVVGGLTFGAPALVPAGKSFKLAASGIALAITPNSSGSSRAKFKLKATGDLSGRIAPDGALALRFTQGAVGALGSVQLNGGKYALGRIRGALIAPKLYLRGLKAAVKGGGGDAFALVAGLATDGMTPGAASDVILQVGDGFTAAIAAASFARRGDKYAFKGSSPGITSLVVDYRKETITVRAKGVDLGAFVEGAQPVRVSIALGADRRDVPTRMVKKGRSLRY